MKESAVQRPTLTHTVDVLVLSVAPSRQRCVGRTCDGWEEDGDESEEEISARHGGDDG